MKKRNLFQRSLSLLMAILLAVPGNLGNIVVAARAAEVDEPAAQQLDVPITISAEWQESEFKNGNAFNLVEYDNSTNAVKLKVSYASQLIREEGYKAGELIITVKGIGNVNRSGPIEALVGADKDGSSAKTRDWSYTWNKTTDMYTLTNNNPIQGNSVFSGYFELVWNLKARDTVHNYTQDNIKATLYIPEEDAISSEVLTFSNETKCDEFTIDIDRGMLYSANGINGGLSTNDYVFVKYTLASHVDQNSRGLIDGEESYYFSTDNNGLGSGGIITHATFDYKNDGNGNYYVTLKTNAPAGEQYAIVAYDRETYVNKEICAYVNHYGAFHEGDDSGNKEQVFLCDDTIEFVIPPDFDFNDQGGSFHESKASAYENRAYVDSKYAQQVADRGGHIPGQRMVNGTVETFYLGFSVQFPIEPGNSVAVDLVDDFMYITQNDGNYRQLQPGDYEYESVVITSTNTVTNENDVPIQSGKYPIKIFAAQNGNILDMSKYPVRPEEPIMDLSAEQTVTETSETVYAAHYAPIREYPSANSALLGSLKTGETIVRIGKLDDFGWSKVQTESGVTGYIYSAYLQTEAPAQPAELVWEGLWMDNEQEIKMPAGTTAVAVRYENLEETIWYNWNPTYVKQPACAINVKFHLNEEGWEADRQSNLVDGQLANTMFINLYDSKGELRNGDNSEEDYDDEDINIDLAQKDIDTYGRYLDRDKGTISFYGGEKSDYTSHTDIASIEGAGTKFNTSLTIGANFEFAETEEPNKFSLYTILADGLSLNGYKTPEDIWNIMTLSGLDMSETQLANACTPEVIKDYNGSGRTYIALHFDFGDTTVPQTGKIRATFELKVSEKVAKTSGTLPARSAVIIDRKVDEYSIGKVTDNGNWADKTGIWSDIDRDGNTEETLARSYDHTSFTYADSSHFEISKFVRTTYTEDWVQLPDVPSEEYGGTYRYKISVRNGNSTASGVVVKDILETGANMQWQGTLQSVDLSQAEKLGMTGTVYYSTTDTPSAELNTGDWSTELKDGTKAVAVDFGESVLEAGKELSVIIVMKAPEDTSLKDKITENGGMVSLTMSDSATGNETKHDSLATNFVQVKLTPPLRSIIAKKTDEVDGTALKDAKLELYDKETGEKVGEAVTNVKGYAIFHDLPADNRTYVLKETEAPYGYTLMEDVEIILEGENKNVTVGDPRKTGSIEVYKVNNLDTEMPVEGATYAIYDITGHAMFVPYTHGSQKESFLTEEQWAKLNENKLVETVVTDKDGSAVFEDLPWGKYLITEKETPDGYDLNTTLYFVEINRENVETPQFVSTENVQKDVSIQLNKYVSTVDGEETNIALPGATFELLRVLESGEKRVGLYVTDENGQILLSELPYGSYFFREYRAPVGYDKAENVEFDLVPRIRDITLDVYDQRKPGSVIITKKDDLGNMVQDIEFTLYAEDKTEVVAKAKTDEYGVAEIRDLEWGTYYLKETDAPDYYVKNEELKQIVINKDSLEWVIEWINETVKGSITLTKTNEDGDVRLPGAVYTLYTADGAVIGNYTTDENGQLTVENLAWGSYYFKETGAPVGYGLSDETIRFSVNSTNAGAVQEMEVTDPLDSKSITLTKRIKAEDINFANGNPTFIFKVEGTDFYGVKHEYYRSLVFNKEYVEACTDENGYVSQSLTISELIAGEYLATEQDSSRYHLTQVKDLVNGYTGAGAQDGVIFDLVGNSDGSAVFVNEKYEHQDYSDTQTLTNIVKSQIKLTGLKAVYGSENVEAQSVVDPELLVVSAVYDDGSTKVLSADEYTLSLESYLKQDGSYEQRFPNKNGDYTVTATYTDPDTNITKSGSFTVTVSGQVPVVVKLSATKAYVSSGSKISPQKFDVTATYNDGTSGLLSEDQYTVTPNVAPDYEGDIEVTIDLNLDAVPNEGRKVSTTAIVTVEAAPVLLAGSTFKSKIPLTAKSVVFTDIEAPNTGTIDVSKKQDGSVLAWLEDTTFYVSSSKPGMPILANADCSDMFNETYNLVTIDFTMLDTSNVTNMTRMFYRDVYLKTLVGIGDWDVSNVVSMFYLFYNCDGLDNNDFYPLSNWDTSNVTDMRSVFEECSGVTYLPGISNWDVSNVTNMGEMFAVCTALKSLDLSKWDTANVDRMYGMFKSCSNIETIYVSDSWSTAKVTDSSNMFGGCTKLVGAAGTKFSSSYVTATRAKLDGGSADPGYLTYSLVLHYDNVSIGETVAPEFIELSENMNYTVTGYKILSGENCVSIDEATGKITGVADGRVKVIAYIKTSAGTSSAVVGEEVYVGDSIKVIYSDDDGSLTFYKNSDTIREGESYNGKTVTTLYEFTEEEMSGFTSTSTIPWYSLRTSIKSVIVADEIRPLTTQDWFSGFSNCVSMDLRKLNTEAVTNMRYMFSGCSKLTSLDLSDWNTANVTDMSYMFQNCSTLTTIYASNAWSTSKVTSSNNMFTSCTKLVGGEGTKFSSSYVTATRAKLDRKSSYGYLTNPLKLTYDKDLVIIGETATPKVTLEGIAKNFTVKEYKVISGDECVSIDEKTGKVTAITDGKVTVNVTVEGLNGCTLTQEATIYTGNVVQVVYSADDGSLTFYKTDDAIKEGNIYNSKKVTNHYRFTEEETSGFTGMLIIPWDSLRTSIKSVIVADEIRPLTTQDWFYGFSNCVSMDLRKLNTEAVTNMRYMFSGCSKLTSLDLSGWNTANVTDMKDAFFGCSGLTSLNVTGWNTAKVTNMSYMFSNCSKLTSLDLSGWNTAKVTNMSYMFRNCSALTTIYVSDSWSTSKVTSSNDMFTSCTKLVGGEGTKFSSSYVTATRAKIDGGTTKPGYLTSTLMLTYDKNPVMIGETATPKVTLNGNTKKFTVKEYKILSGGDCVSIDEKTGKLTAIGDGKVTIKVTVEGLNGCTFTKETTIVAGNLVQVVFSADDGSLTFYKNSDTIREGESYKGKTVTNLYQFSERETSGFTSTSTIPWYGLRRSVESVVVADEIKPLSTAYWFYNMYNCTNMELANLNTSKVTEMYFMFCGCESLTSLNLSSWDTANVINMYSMFASCYNLQTIYAGTSWSTSSLVGDGNESLFDNCTSLVGGSGTVYDNRHVDAAYAKADGGTEDPGYFTGIELSYKLVPVGETITPNVTMYGDYTITGYEIVSGEEYITIDENSGAVTGLKDGYAIVKVTAKDADGNIVTTQSNVNVGQAAYAVYSDDDGSLTFYKTGDEIIEGETYNGKTATKVYTNIERTAYVADMDSGYTNVPWLIDGNFVNVTSVVVRDEIKPVSTEGWFMNMENCTSMNLTKLNTEAVTNMRYMFFGCFQLTSLNLSGWNTANVTDMSSMFDNCSSLTSLDVSIFDTSKVKYMSHMFHDCQSLTSLDISNWDTSNVEYTNWMFAYCTNLTEIKGITDMDVSKVTDMYRMFSYCESLTELNLSGWNTSSVQTTYGMFEGCADLATIYASSNFIVSDSVYSEAMFADCESLVGGADTVYNSEYVDAAYAKIDGGADNPGYFTGISLSYDLVRINETVAPDVTISNGFTVTGYEIVSGSEYLSINEVTGTATGIKEGVAVIKVTTQNTAGITVTAKANVDVGRAAYAVFSEDDGSLTFYKTGDEIIEGESYNGKTASVVYANIEKTVYAVDMNSGNTNVPWVLDGVAEAVTNVVFAGEIKPVSTAGWFMYMTNCTSMDLSKLNTSNVNDMSFMFMYCIGLTELDVSGFDTSKVTNMMGTFAGVMGVTELDVSSFDTSKVTKMFRMFLECYGLTTIYASDSWNTSGLIDYGGEEVFVGCEQLVGGAGTVYDGAIYDDTLVDAVYAKIDGGANDPGYFTDVADKPSN